MITKENTKNLSKQSVNKEITMFSPKVSLGRGMYNEDIGGIVKAIMLGDHNKLLVGLALFIDNEFVGVMTFPHVTHEQNKMINIYLVSFTQNKELDV